MEIPVCTTNDCTFTRGGTHNVIVVKVFRTFEMKFYLFVVVVYDLIQCHAACIILKSRPCVDPEGGQGVRTPPPPPGKLQNIGFLSNYGPDPLKITKLPIKQCWATIGPPVKRHLNGVSLHKWRFTGGPLLAH